MQKPETRSPFLDISLPELNGMEVARLVMKENASQRILVLTDIYSERAVQACLDVGVRGWVFKSEVSEDLTTAVEAMERHKSIFSPRVSDLIMDGYKRHRLGHSRPMISELSPRQREIVQLVVEGKTSKEVALALDVKVKTAETHRSNIMQKLKIHSIAELVLYAVRNEIIQVQLPVAVLQFPQPASDPKDCLAMSN